MSLLAESRAADQSRSNSKIDEAPTSEGTTAKSSNFGPCMGNFSIQYNFTSASIAVSVVSDPGFLGRPLAEQPEWSHHITLPIVFIGAMIGMLTMGRLGDVIGRARAMRVTLFFTMLGAIVPALAAGPPDALYAIVCSGRLILGIGVGGIYPLSAVASAEGQQDSARRAYTVAWAFFWQSVGAVVPYLLALLMIGLSSSAAPVEWIPSLEFRLLFALGVLPAAIVFITTKTPSDKEEVQAQPSAQPSAQPGVIETLRKQPLATKLTLVGTAGSWFVWDVIFYGTAIFTPIILEDIFGKQTLFSTSWQSVIVTLMGVPGCIMGIMLIKRWGSKRLNVLGFLALAVCFAAMAILWQQEANSALIFGVFCILNFFFACGPNLGTYVLPAICFPAEVRSTFHGISATGGKLGAMVGALLFPVIRQGPFGIVGVLWMEAGACIIGAIISYQFLQNDWEYLDEDDKMATMTFVHGSATSFAGRSSARASSFRALGATSVHTSQAPRVSDAKKQSSVASPV